MKKSVVIPQMKKTKRARYCLFDERGIIDACLLVIDGSIRVCCNDFVTHTHTHTQTHTHTHTYIHIHYTHAHTYTQTHTHYTHAHTHTHTHPHTHIDGNLDTGPGQHLLI